MLQIWLLINYVLAQKIQIKNLSLQRDQDDNIISIKFDTDFLSDIQIGYLYMYGVNMHEQNNNEVHLKMHQINGPYQYFTQAINIEYHCQFEYYFHLNFEAKDQYQYQIEIFPNQFIKEFKEIIVMKITQSLDKNSFIYGQFFGDWKSIRNNISNVNTILADGFIYSNYNSLKIMQNNINLLKAFVLINQTLEGIEIIFEFYQYNLNFSNDYQQVKRLNNCWSNQVNYYCNNSYDNVSLTINQQVKQNSLIEVILEFSNVDLSQFNSINTSILNIETNLSLHNFYIQSTKQNKFYSNELKKLKQNRILQQFDHQIPSTILDYLNQLFESICEDKTSNNQCDNIQNYINPQNFTLNKIVLQQNTNKSLNFEDQLLISKKNSIKTITLNMTGVPDGQFMWYEVQINNTNNQNQSLDGIITTNNQLQNYQSITQQFIQNVNQTVSWNGSFIFQNISGLYQSSYVIDGEQLLNYSQHNFTECLGLGASVVGNFSNLLTSICNSNDQSYIIQSTIPQTNYSQLINNSLLNNTTQLITNFSQLNYSQSDIKDSKMLNNVIGFFDDIKKVFQLQTYIFILGRTNFSKYFEIHVFDINYLNSSNTREIETISCFNTTKYKDSYDSKIHYSNVSDFNITILQNKSVTFNNTYSSRGVVFYICEQPNSLRYRGFNFVNTYDISFHKLSTKFNDNITCCLHNKNITLNQVFIYTVIFDQLIIFITSDSSYSMAFMMSFTPLIDEREILQIEEIVAIIPPYGNWIQSAKAVLNNAFLLLVFKNNLHSETYSLAIYNLTKFNKQILNQQNTQGKHNLTYMIAGTQSYKLNGTIEQIVIVNQSLNDGAIIMGIVKYNNTSKNTNQTGIFTFVFNPNLSIQIDFSKFNSSNKYSLVGYNNFNNTSAQIYIQAPKSNREYIIILSCSLILLIVVCSYLVILFKRKVGEIESRFQQLNENKEIELK